MKKVSTHWQQALPPERIGSAYFEEFAARAQSAAAKVFRVKTAAEAQGLILDIIKSSGTKKMVATKEVLSPSGLCNRLHSMDVTLYCEQSDIRVHADTADLGIARVEFGIAETGSVCEDSLAIEQRLVTTLPPISIVLMNSSHVVPSIAAAFETISQVFDHGYISFITGPSRTSDIERVLTIGVHGPSQFIIIAIDEATREV